jgi:hypothetical protein
MLKACLQDAPPAYEFAFQSGANQGDPLSIVAFAWDRWTGEFDLEESVSVTVDLDKVMYGATDDEKETAKARLKVMGANLIEK